MVFGKSKSFEGNQIPLTSVNFSSFSPMSCVFLTCFNSKAQQSRQYMNVYPNRIEINQPTTPFLCFTTTERCVNDNINILYYDRY
jgi:hypothetical protein